MDFTEGNHPESFLQFSDNAVISSLNNVGISLGADDSSKKDSITLLKSLEKDRLQNSFTQDLKSKAIDLDEKEIEDTETVDLLMLNQLCGDITEVLVSDSEHILAPTVPGNKHGKKVGLTKTNKVSK